VYRDMKPSNVMLTGNGRVVLVDFGIARLFKGQRKGTMIGTLGFAPPEQYQGVADPRSDLYSLGATLHYVLTGRDPEKFPPFSFPPIRELRPDISSNLAGSIDRTLKYEMAGRPATVQEFRDMLLYGRGLAAPGAAHVSGKSGTADLALPPPSGFEDFVRPHRARKSAKRRAIGMGLFTIVLGGLAFGATYIYSNPGVQVALGVKPFVDSLPWKHEEILSRAREHPLDFDRMTLMLSTRAGSPLSAPKANFTDTELTTNRYLKWNASFKNNLAGLEGRDDRVEARFYDPKGTQIATSTDQRFVGPSQTAIDFSSVALIPDSSAILPGNYRIALFADDRRLAEQRFSVSEDLAARAAAERAKAAARSEEGKRKDEARRLAMIQERMRRPLRLQEVEFVNSTKDGTVLSGPTNAFNVSKVLFVGWRVIFQNLLFGLDTNQYRVDAVYVAPDGSMLGSVDDVQIVKKGQDRAVFSGRVGNSAGGAFLPGQYTVNFYLNNQYFAQKKFNIVADAGVPYGGGGLSSSGGGGAGATVAGLETPTLATGTIEKIGGRENVPMELRLRPQPNGFLHGELVVHLPGYDAMKIDGFVRGNRVQFTAAHGAETFYFEGERSRDVLGGTFEATPSGERGSWTTHAD
jgi:Protein kinase domain